jgi:hypothetical protein
MTLSEKKLKAQIFPSDDISLDEIHRMVLELAANDLITLYSVENIDYIQINGWKHQRIDKPQKSRYPDIRGMFEEVSENGRLRNGMEWKGREKNQQREESKL